MYEDSDNQSSKSKMAINATVLPNAVKKHAEELLKNKLLKGVDADGADIKKGSSITADVWDFAGQHLYYAAHPVFLSSRAVYIVVHNLSKPLNARAQPCVRQGTHEVPLENPKNETNLENLLSWLVTVHNVRSTGEEMVETPNVLPYLRPPVFIVGTHSDKPYEDTKDVTSKILREISSKEYGKHVIRPFFFIDNTQGDQSLARKFRNFFKFERNPQAGKSGVWVQHNVLLRLGFTLISIEDRQTRRQIKSIRFTGDLPVAFLNIIPCILLSQSGLLYTFDVGTLLVLRLFLDFFSMYFLYFLLFIFFVVLTWIAYVNTIANVFADQITFDY